MEEMLDPSCFESLDQLKVVGLSQFTKEEEQTRDLDPSRQVCDMNKLYVNTETGEKIDVHTITEHDEVILEEHCSPRILF